MMTRNSETGEVFCELSKRTVETDPMLAGAISWLKCDGTEDAAKAWKADAAKWDFKHECYDPAKHYKVEYYTDSKCTKKWADDEDFKNWSGSPDYQYYSKGCNTENYKSPWHEYANTFYVVANDTHYTEYLSGKKNDCENLAFIHGACEKGLPGCYNNMKEEYWENLESWRKSVLSFQNLHIQFYVF